MVNKMNIYICIEFAKYLRTHISRAISGRPLDLMLSNIRQSLAFSFPFQKYEEHSQGSFHSGKTNENVQWFRWWASWKELLVPLWSSQPPIHPKIATVMYNMFTLSVKDPRVWWATMVRSLSFQWLLSFGLSERRHKCSVPHARAVISVKKMFQTLLTLKESSYSIHT